METIFHQAEIQLIPSISLIPKIVSEPMFQSLRVRRLYPGSGGGGGGGFELGEFDFIAAKFQMAVGVWF